MWAWLRADRRRMLALVAAPLILAAGALTAVITARPGTPQPTPIASPSPTPTLTPTPTPTPTPPPSPTPTSTPELSGLADGRITILVLGSDSSAERRGRGTGGLTDAITLVSLAADGSDVVLISLPRDSTDFPMPDGSTWRTKVNAIVELRGIGTMKEAMAGVFGIEIDNYLMVDMDDFPKIVDAVGGVTVSVPYTLSDNRARSRRARSTSTGPLLCASPATAIQTATMRAPVAISSCCSPCATGLLAGNMDLAALAASLGSLQTDIQLIDLPQYVELLRMSADAEVNRLVLQPPTYTTFAGTTADRGWISIPDIEAIHRAVYELTGQ